MEMIQYTSTPRVLSSHACINQHESRTEKSPVHPRLVSTSLALIRPPHLVVGGCHSFCFLNPRRRGLRDFAHTPTSPIIIDSSSCPEAETSRPPSSLPHHREAYAYRRTTLSGKGSVTIASVSTHQPCRRYCDPPLLQPISQNHQLPRQLHNVKVSLGSSQKHGEDRVAYALRLQIWIFCVLQISYIGDSLHLKEEGSRGYSNAHGRSMASPSVERVSVKITTPQATVNPS